MTIGYVFTVITWTILKSMNCIVRNTLFRNPATQFLGVMFATTHKEPEIRQLVQNPAPAFCSSGGI